LETSGFFSEQLTIFNRSS